MTKALRTLRIHNKGFSVTLCAAKQRPDEEVGSPAADMGWLDRVYSLVASGETDDAVDLIFDFVDDRLLEGDAARVDDLLVTTDVKRLDTTLMLAVLSITKPASDQLCNRAAFLRRVEARLRLEEPERMERLLSGLR